MEMLTSTHRLKLHMQVEQCESIEELKVLCRALIERELAYKEILKEAGIHRAM